MIADPTSAFGSVLGVVLALMGAALVFGGLRMRIVRDPDGGFVVYEPTSRRQVSPGASVFVDSGSHEVVLAKLWYPIVDDHGERIELTSYASYVFLGGRLAAERRAKVLRDWLDTSGDTGLAESGEEGPGRGEG
jgi:hypothetical protein